MSDLPKRLYVGAQNDILYLVDEPPSPAGNDYPLATAGSDPIAKFFASDRRTQQLAQALVDAYNAEIDVADKRAQAHLLAAGWLPPDEAARLKEELDAAKFCADEALLDLRSALRREAEGDDLRDDLRVQLAAMEPVVKLLWPDGGAKRVPFDYAYQLPEAVEWLLQQRVSLTELLDKAERELAAVQPVIEAARAVLAWLNGEVEEEDSRPHALLAQAFADLDGGSPEGPKQ